VTLNAGQPYVPSSAHVSCLAQTSDRPPVIIYPAACAERQRSLVRGSHAQVAAGQVPPSSYRNDHLHTSHASSGAHGSIRIALVQAICWDDADARRWLEKQERTRIMPLIQLLEVLVVVGVLLWLVNRFIPMQGSIKSILNGVVVIAVVLWLLNVFGLFHSLSRIRLGS
jgi:hypothetical protein